MTQETSNRIKQCYNVKNKIDSLGRNIKISAAVKTNPILSKKKWSQDWNSWINEGLVDFVVAMNYDSDIINFSNNIRYKFYNL